MLNKKKRQIEAAIARKSILLWSYKHRKIKVSGQGWENYTIEDYPFLKGIFHAIQNPDTDQIIIKKATQVGITELAVSSAFYFLDVMRENVLYMLPNQGQLGDFAHSRLDQVIENSPYLKDLFSDVSNVGLKVSGKGSIYLRGANSASGLEEFPCGYVIRDELSRMDQSNANLAFKRLGSSKNAWKLDLGHPSFGGCAVSSEYANSSRYEWVFECPNCGEIQPVDFFDNFHNRDNEFGCRGCSENWTQKDVINQGFWKAAGDADNPLKGFHISRMLSPVETLDNLAKEYEKAKSEGGFKLSQFYNTVLGEPHTAEGDRIIEKDIRELMTGPKMAQVKAEGSVLGVDTGKPLYWAVLADNAVLAVGKATGFERLTDIVNKYNCKTVLADAMPEPIAVSNWFADLPKGIRGYMVRTKGSGDITQPDLKRDSQEIKAHQVWLFDNLYSKINSGELTFPQDLPSEAVEHLTNPIRVIEKDGKGNPKPTYRKGTCHYADAIKFALVPAVKGVMKKKRKTISGVPGKSRKEKSKRAFRPPKGAKVHRINPGVLLDNE